MSERNLYSLNEISDKKKADEWSLVLTSRGIDHTVENIGFGWTIVVDDFNRFRAQREIESYEEENIKKPSLPKAAFHTVNRYKFTVVPLLLLLFHLYRVGTPHEKLLLKIGRASADLITAGELFRTVTSLTLHADLGHVMSNIVFGSIAAYALCRKIGSGFSWFLILLSGAMGNFLNAVAYGSNHNAIGASTAVFGAIGILGALQLYPIFRREKLKAWIPLAAALALLGLLGAGKNSDTGAHLFGFISGVSLGAAGGFLLTRLQNIKNYYQILFSAASILIVSASWFIALKN